MPREKESYRDNLELISNHFGAVQLIPFKEAAKYCGVNARALQSDSSFPLKKIGGRYYVSAVNLARWLS